MPGKAAAANNGPRELDTDKDIGDLVWGPSWKLANQGTGFQGFLLSTALEVELVLGSPPC